MDFFLSNIPIGRVLRTYHRCFNNGGAVKNLFSLSTRLQLCVISFELDM